MIFFFKGIIAFFLQLNSIGVIKGLLNTLQRITGSEDIKAFHRKVTYKEWEWKGRHLVPPYLLKRDTLADFGKKYGAKTLVETGTAFGDMVHAQLGN
ncbi:MAG: hypothetical protein JNM63_02055, partial [Spirochaetia bacterium]|nr:hypothetical protein [Spirochaetia bacterium]